MPDVKTPHADPRDYRISRLLFVRIWRLAKPFWTEKSHWKIWILASLLLLTIPAFSYFSFRTAHLVADMTNAIVAKQESRYVYLFWLTTGIGMATFVVTSITSYLTNRINLYWTQWLTDWMVDRYLAHRTYYDIAMREDLDNPDQRIQGDIPPVIMMVASIPERLIQQVLGVITGGIIIASIDMRMTVFVLIYTVMSTIIMIASYAPSIRYNFESTMAGADLRYGILHVRDNAETVAFYKGEENEHNQIRDRIGRSIGAQTRVLNYNFIMGVVNQVLRLIWDLAPFFLIAPLFFAGKIEYGAIAMATMGAGQMKEALNQLVTFLPSIAASAPSAVRVAHILERFDKMDADREREAENLITVKRGPAIMLDNVSLETPGGEQKLFRNINLDLPLGSTMVIVGQTGVGKSSMLRAMAGLWRRGDGRIVMPPVEDCLFLPQRPYMILGTLRSQLVYPRGGRGISDAELQRVLERVCLPHLLAKHGGLDAERDWGKVLSLGEQQRVAFARIFVSGAKIVFLDEATSAVDIATEATLYQGLKDEGITFVSVGHRETILAFHDEALELLPGGGWRILPITKLRKPDIMKMGMERA